MAEIKCSHCAHVENIQFGFNARRGLLREAELLTQCLECGENTVMIITFMDNNKVEVKEKDKPGYVG